MVAREKERGISWSCTIVIELSGDSKPHWTVGVGPRLGTILEIMGELHSS